MEFLLYAIAMVPGWVQGPDGHPWNYEDTNADIHVNGTHVRNPQPNAIYVTQSVAYSVADQVTGSASTQPSWTSNYTPLKDDLTSTSGWSNSDWVPQNYESWARAKLHKYSGKESWYEQGTPEIVLTRSRYKTTNFAITLEMQYSPD